MKNEIIVSLDESFTPNAGLTSWVSWKRLVPCLEKAVGATRREKVVGFIIDQNGIRVRLECTD